MNLANSDLLQTDADRVYDLGSGAEGTRSLTFTSDGTDATVNFEGLTDFNVASGNTHIQSDDVVAEGNWVFKNGSLTGYDTTLSLIQFLASGNVEISGNGSSYFGSNLAALFKSQYGEAKLLSVEGNAVVASTEADVQLDAGSDVTIHADTGNIYLSTQDTSRVYISHTGNVGVGTTSPTYSLDVSSDAAVRGLLYLPNLSDAAGDIVTYTGNALYKRTASEVVTDLATPLGAVYFKLNGNSFGANAVMGTNDNYSLSFETNGAKRAGIENNGLIYIGSSGAATNPYIYPISGGSASYVGGGKGLMFYNNYSSDAGGTYSFLFYGSGMGHTSGNAYNVASIRGFSPTSGSGSYAALLLNNTINQTGGANGTTRGIYILDILTSAADYRAVETANNTGLAFYAAGTAPSRFNGAIGMSTTPVAGQNFINAKTITGSVNSVAFAGTGQVQSDVIGTAQYYYTSVSTQSASFTLPTLYHFVANQGTFGAGSTVTNQYGFMAQSSLIGATNNYGFYGNIPFGTGRWNLYMNGTASNYFAGTTLIGTTNDVGGTLQVNAQNSGALGGIITLANTAVLASGTATEMRFAPTSSPTIRYAKITAVNDGSNNISLSLYAGNGASITEMFKVGQSGAYLITASNAAGDFVTRNSSTGQLTVRTTANLATDLSSVFITNNSTAQTGASNKLFKQSYISIPGEGALDFGMTGLFDRNELTNAVLKGSASWSITAGSGSVYIPSVPNVIFDAASQGATTIASGTDATTTMVIVVDIGTLINVHSRALWQPFVDFRLSNQNRFESITVEVSPDNTTWYAPASGWSTTAFSTSSVQGTGLWVGTESNPGVPGYVWRYARFTFSNAVAATGYIYLNRIGIRHVSAEYAQQYMKTSGDSMWGTLSLKSVSNATGDILTRNTSTGLIGSRTPTQLLSDIGAVSGSGTTNYVPKFTASGTIGNSLLYIDAASNNVGIGYTTVPFKFSVQGDAIYTENGGDGIVLADYYQLSTESGLYNVNGDQRIGSYDINDTKYRYGGDIGNSNAPLTILSDGKIGFNNSSPAYQLHVNGDIATSESLYLYDSANAVYTSLSINDYTLEAINNGITSGIEFAATVNRHYVLPDADGTIALQSWVSSNYQPALSGTGLLYLTGTTPSYIHSTTNGQILRVSGGVEGFGSIDLGTSVSVGSTVLRVGNGGTGTASITGIVIGNGSSTMTAVAGTANQLLRRNAANTAYEFFSPAYLDAIPSWQNVFDVNATVDMGIYDNPMTATYNGDRFLFLDPITDKISVLGDYDGSQLGAFLVINNTEGFTNIVKQAIISDDNASGMNAHAALEISSTDKGLMLPRLETATRTSMSLSTSDAGLVVFDTGVKKVYYWDGSSWVGL